MRLVFWGKGGRGLSCLRMILERGEDIALVVSQPSTSGPSEVDRLAEKAGIPVISPDDPNTPQTVSMLREQGADLFVLAGYGKIVSKDVFAIPPRGTINLHAGALPSCRGSSPLNWALIRGHESYGLSIIQVDGGVDTGPVLAQRRFPIGSDDSIVDLHATADAEFPEMLGEVLDGLRDGTCRPQPQDPRESAYYPLRFPDDGLVLWDMLTASDVHNRTRALTEPYPCAFTLYAGRKVRLFQTCMRDRPFYGEPGRVYRKENGRLLVCARDRCLWVDRACFDDGTPLYDAITRYDRLATVAEAAHRILTGTNTS